ncbi:minor capsid protein [Hyphomicrobium sp.]|uniref:minor capsid protein n=1 Tax=Hyphomicrobium sp. TaxID=82 RepID=UPI001D76B79E|nr:minor capsid protein [Hyphomicrobium sp.]MBY0559852.1 minor capsid protein [Hyphomicrobium sp.]
MATPAQQNALISHRVGLEHFSNGVVRKVLRHLSEVEADVTNALHRGGDIRTKAKLQKQLQVIHDLQKEGEQVLRGIAEEGLSSAVLAEAHFLDDFYTEGKGPSQLFDYPSASTLVAGALAEPLANKHLEAWIRKLTNDQIREVNRQIRIGVTLGEGIDTVVKRLGGSIGAFGADSVWARSKRSAETFVRTGVSHVSNQAHKIFIDNNADVFAEWVHVSVLDSRTSDICQSLAGHVYDRAEDVEWPPLHPACRSTIIGVPKGTSAKSLKFDTFEDWLKRQSPAKIHQILGPARSRLYLEGKIKADRFFNNKNHMLTLEELKAQNKGVWTRAFGNDN